jgi:hypothetical protein
MRVHYVLNHGGTPASKLADVEIHFEEGLLAGLKLVGCSVWRSKKGEAPTVLVPSRSYATAGGVRYYELLRASTDGAPAAAGAVEDPAASSPSGGSRTTSATSTGRSRRCPTSRPSPPSGAAGKRQRLPGSSKERSAPRRVSGGGHPLQACDAFPIKQVKSAPPGLTIKC